MADKQLTMRLDVDKSKIDQATAAQLKLAAAIRQTAAAQKEATKATVDFNRANAQAAGGGPGFSSQIDSSINPSTYARNQPATRQQLEARASRDARRAAVQQIRDATPGSSGGGGSMFMGGGLRALGGLAAIHTANRVAGAVGGYIGEHAGDVGGVNWRRAANQGLESLPLVGGFAKLGNEYGRMDQTAAYSNASRIEQSGGLNRELFAAQRQAQFERRDLAVGAQDARIEATSARQFASYAGANAGKYVTEDRIGVSNADTGNVRYAADQAAFAQDAATKQAEAQAQRAAQSKAEADAASKEAADAQARQAATQVALNARKDQQSKQSAVWENDPAGRAKNDKAIATLTEQSARDQENALAKVAAAEDAITRSKEEQKKLAEANKNATMAQYTAAQASLDIERNKLQVLNAQKAKLEDQARSFAELEDYQKQQAIDALKTLKASGGNIGSLSQEQKGLIRDTTAYKDAAKKTGENDPLYKPYSDLTGDGNVTQATEQAKKLAQEINTSNAALMAQFKEQLAASQEASVKGIGDAVIESLRALEQRLRAEFTKGQNAARSAEERQ